MWRIHRDYGYNVEKSLLVVFSHRWKKSDYRSLWDYAWQRTSFKWNASAFGLLVLWLVLKIGFVATLDVKEDRVSIQLCEVVSTICGSLIAAYIFRLVFIHWPESAKKYIQQEKIESYVSSVLLHHYDLIVELLIDHERAADHGKSIYHELDVMIPLPIYRAMVSVKDGKERQSFDDPFWQHFYQKRSSIHEAAQKLQEHEADLPWDDFNQMGIALALFTDNRSFGREPGDDEFHRLYALNRLTVGVIPYYLYAKGLVSKDRHVSPVLEASFTYGSFHEVWGTIAQRKAREQM